MSSTDFPGWHGTTIIGVKKGGEVVIAGDGQVSLGQTVIKGTARKVRRLSPGGYDIVAGFAGSTADAFALLERLEAKLESTPGQLARASVELAKDWRTDKYLQKLEAMLIVSDGADIFVITGAGDARYDGQRSFRRTGRPRRNGDCRGYLCLHKWKPDGGNNPQVKISRKFSARLSGKVLCRVTGTKD